MIRIVGENASTKKNYNHEELLNIIKTIDDIIKNSEYEYDNNYVLSFDDMASVKESIRKLKEGFSCLV